MDPVKAEFKSNGLLEFFSVLVTWKAKGTVQTLQSVFYFSFTFHEFLVRLHVAAHTPPLPPPRWNGSKGISTKPLPPIMFCNVTLL